MAVVVTLFAGRFAPRFRLAQQPFQLPGPPEQRSHPAGYDAYANRSLLLFVVQMGEIGACGPGEVARLVQLPVEEAPLALEPVHCIRLEAPALVVRERGSAGQDAVVGVTRRAVAERLVRTPVSLFPVRIGDAHDHVRP